MTHSPPTTVSPPPPPPLSAPLPPPLPPHLPRLQPSRCRRPHPAGGEPIRSVATPAAAAATAAVGVPPPCRVAKPHRQAGAPPCKRPGRGRAAAGRHTKKK